MESRTSTLPIQRPSIVEIAGLIVFVGILASGLLAAAYYALYSL
jgi:hypothetical protein